MNNQLQNKCFNEYKYYFSPTNAGTMLSPVNGKENVPN